MQDEQLASLFCKPIFAILQKINLLKQFLTSNQLNSTQRSLGAVPVINYKMSSTSLLHVAKSLIRFGHVQRQFPA